MSLFSVYLLILFSIYEVKCSDRVLQDRGDLLKYAVVLDGGSTRTEVHAFTVNCQSKDVSVFQLKTKSTIDGVTLYEDVESLTSGITDLVSRVLNEFPKYSHVSLYFKGTGGLRNSDIQTTNKLLEYISIAFQRISESTEFLHVTFDPETDISVITGEEEGVFGWIALNTISHKVNGKQGYLGFLDLGGASTQIVIPKEKPSEGTSQVAIEGESVSIYVKSFPIGAFASSFNVFLEYYIRAYESKNPKEPGTVLSNPCMYYHQEYYYNGYRFIGGEEFDFESCYSAISILFKDMADEFEGTIGDVEFHGITGFTKLSKVVKYISMVNNRGLKGKNKWESVTTFLCGSVSRIGEYIPISIFPKQDIIPFIGWTPTLVVYLLTEVYKFPDIDRITMADEIGGVKLSWAYGFISDSVKDWKLCYHRANL